MTHPRITLFAGHFGSGKTTWAVNTSLDLRRRNPETPLILADLDIVNPFVRATDHRAELNAHNITLVAPPYAGSNVDLPFLPQEMYAVTDRTDTLAVVDLGGDERGALALGRLTHAIRDEDHYAMLLVINRYRPRTGDAEATLRMMDAIETAARLPFTGIVNNSNLGRYTSAETVLDSLPYADRVSRLSGRPLIHTGFDRQLESALDGRVPDPYPLTVTEE